MQKSEVKRFLFHFSFIIFFSFPICSSLLSSPPHFSSLHSFLFHPSSLLPLYSLHILLVKKRFYLLAEKGYLTRRIKFLSFSDFKRRPQEGSFSKALPSPMIIKHLLALVMATFILLSSERNPMGPPYLLERTQEKMTMSFSRPFDC